MSHLAQPQAPSRNNSSNLWNSLKDYLESIPLPDKLKPYRSAVTSIETVEDFKNISLPEKPLNDQQTGGLYGVRSAQKHLARGAHRVTARGASTSSTPGLRAISERIKLAGRAAANTPGGRLFGGLFRGTARLGGRLIAPALFALDVFSEEDRFRGAAKATGGLAASSLGFMLGSAVGAGIGTLFSPIGGTALGYYAGGLIGAAIAYGWGKTAGTSIYDWTKKEHPQLIQKAKGLSSTGLRKAKDLGSQTISAIKQHGPGLIAKAKNFLHELLGQPQQP